MILATAISCVIGLVIGITIGLFVIDLFKNI